MRLAGWIFLALTLSQSVFAVEPAKVDYLREVKPILQSRCFSCHSALRQKGGLRLDAAVLMNQGGDKGPAVVAHKSADSLLIDAVTGKNGLRLMPPKEEGEPLSAKEVAVLKAWIDQGAAAPKEPIPEDPRKHWAFHSPVRPPIPTVSDPAWAKNPIDAFLAAEHAKHKLTPRPIASRAVLLRRVYLDLVGLPPTREELHAFLADASSDAYEKVVDRLLASPQHGERWGRHWMDVWRYSDWYGRRAVPDVWNSAPQVWRWRDWIVKSLNADTGYDRMVMEMLAADEIAPEDDEAGVATGFLVRNWYALNPNQWMRENVEHVGKAFLGLTFNCCHCHDHKYDPISQEEYFRFRAFFEPLGLRQDRWQGEADPGPFQRYDYSVLRKIVPLGAVRVLDENPEAKTHYYLGGDERNRANRPPMKPGAPTFLNGDRLKIEPVNLPPTAWYPGLKPWLQQAERERTAQETRLAKEKLEQARQELAFVREQQGVLDGMAQDPKRPQPPAAVDARQKMAGRLTAAQVALRLSEARLARAEAEQQAVAARMAADRVRYGLDKGDADSTARKASQAHRQFLLTATEERQAQAEQAKGPTAAAQQKSAAAAVDAARKALAAVSADYPPLTPVYLRTSTGRRTALARWLVSRDNPLTARVAVNHLWLHHFDRPLVDSVFDFGRNGKKPSHPELLDFLAVELMGSGWTMKKLHRLIVTSRAYRIESAMSDPDHLNRQIDPDNRWLWRFPAKRMEAELVRDSVLHAAGQLDLTMGGRTLELAVENTTRRRSLYYVSHPEAQGHLMFLEAFDAPDACDCYRRTASVLPQQALALTNSQLLLDQSRVLAARLGTAASQEDAFVTAAFEQVLSRSPSAPERQLCRDFLKQQAETVRKAGGQADAVQRARESLIRVLFSHDDFVTIR